jgi:hypothetical protein
MILCKWYPNQLKKPDDWVHKECLALIGLYPYPLEADRPLEEMVAERMAYLSRQETTDDLTPTPCPMQALMTELFEKMIPVVEPAVADPEVCDGCHRKNIRGRKCTTPSHSDVNAKRAHREWIIQVLTGRLEPEHPALLYLDDKLPMKAAEGDTSQTYFTQDLLTSPALSGRIRPDQLFSPNIKGDVVQDLRRLGVIHTAESCVCLFLKRYASLIRDYHGGLALMFLDVWGSFENGARPLMALSLSLRLVDPSGCFVTFAASDRSASAQGRTAVEAHANVEEEAQACIRGAGLLEWHVAHPPSLPLKYRTMHVYGWMMQEH